MRKGDKVILNKYQHKMNWKGIITDIYINDNITIYQVIWSGLSTWDLSNDIIEDKQGQREEIISKIID